jgi:hypothetical protein
MSENQIEWLMGGDPAIRWQVLNDLLDSSRSDVDAERRLVSETGWGRELIAVQGVNGRWAADSGPEAFRGLHSPKWTSTTYTLLLLRRLGLDPESEAARLGCRAIVEGAHWTDDGDLRLWSSDTPDGSWEGNSRPMADTISVLEALELRRRRHPDDELGAAMESAHEYLLERNLFR